MSTLITITMTSLTPIEPKTAFQAHHQPPTASERSDSNYLAYSQLHSLILEHLKQKQEFFHSVNTLVAKLHDAQRLLEADKPKEALLIIEQLVHYGETLTRQL